MNDKLENTLAQGIEEDAGLKAMAQKLAPRPDALATSYNTPRTAQPSTIESKLVAIERLIGEVRALTAQIRERL